MKRHFIVRAAKDSEGKRIIAAEFDDEDIDTMDFDGELDDVDDGFNDKLDDVADAIEDVQDTVDDVTEDPTNIEVENNIDDHYIAECEKCGGVFISATVESDQDVEKVTGECPLCGEQSDQYLKWIVRKVDHSPQDDNIVHDVYTGTSQA